MTLSKKEKLEKIAEQLFGGGTLHPDYSDGEDAVRCRDCKCNVHLCTATRAAGFDINGEYLCSMCVEGEDKE